LLEKSFNEFTSEEFRKHAARFANQIAGSPAMFLFSWALYLVLWVIIWLFPAPQLSIPFLIRLPAFIVLFLLWAFLIGPRSRGTLWGWWGMWLYTGLLIAGIVTIPVTWWLLHWYWPVLILVAVLFTLSRRHLVSGMAFGSTIRTPSANAEMRLESLKSGVRHIFCATELHVGRHMFLSPDFVYIKDFGLGVPGSLRICDAVQLSANFPGGFPFRRLRADKFRFVKTLPSPELSKLLVLTDGGVYDNTATSWYLEPEIIFQIRWQQRADELAREAAKTNQIAEQLFASMNEPKQEVSSRELISLTLKNMEDPVLRGRFKVIVEQMEHEANGEVDIRAVMQRLMEPVDSAMLATSPKTVQSILDELGDGSVELIAINAAYPPSIQQANLVSWPMLCDIACFTKTTETLYNNDNHHRLRELRGLFLNKKVEGTLVSIEEHPDRLAEYLANPDRWFSGILPDSESVPEESKMAAYESRLRSEILSFYAKAEYMQDKSIQAQTIDRARETMEYWYPDYQRNMVTSDQEKDRIQELSDKIRGVQEDLKPRQEFRTKLRKDLARAKEELAAANREARFDRQISKLEVALTKEEYEISKIVRTLTMVESELREVTNYVANRKREATLKVVPHKLALENLTKTNHLVATTLCPLGVETTANLLYQGYLCAMNNLHVLMKDYPLLPKPRFEDFKQLVEERTETPSLTFG